MAAKTPTAQGVSAALRKAGFDRSETRSGTGWWPHDYTEGYQARRWGKDDGEVRVEHTTGSGRGPDDRARCNAKLTEYAETLAAAGWASRRIESVRPCLLVTMKVED